MVRADFSPYWCYLDSLVVNLAKKIFFFNFLHENLKVFSHFVMAESFEVPSVAYSVAIVAEWFLALLDSFWDCFLWVLIKFFEIWSFLFIFIFRLCVTYVKFVKRITDLRDYVAWCRSFFYCLSFITWLSDKMIKSWFWKKLNLIIFYLKILQYFKWNKFLSRQWTKSNRAILKKLTIKAIKEKF